MINPFQKLKGVATCSACGQDIYLGVDRFRRVTAGRTVYHYHLPTCPTKEKKDAPKNLA